MAKKKDKKQKKHGKKTKQSSACRSVDIMKFPSVREALRRTDEDMREHDREERYRTAQTWRKMRHVPFY